jgi:hypothetical protein
LPCILRLTCVRCNGRPAQCVKSCPCRCPAYGATADAYGIARAVRGDRARARAPHRRHTVIQLCCAVTSVWLKVPRALNASHFGLFRHAIRPHGPFGLGTLQCMDSLDMCSMQTDRLKMYAALTDAIGLVRWLGARARPGLMLPPISPHGVPASWLRT